jgi:hypothetical protein
MHLENSQSHALLVQAQGARGHGRLSGFNEISIRDGREAHLFVSFGWRNRGCG